MNDFSLDLVEVLKIFMLIKMQKIFEKSHFLESYPLSKIRLMANYF